MHAVVIGGTGHVGTYLVPRLVRAGYDVTNVSRSQSEPYLPDKAWQSVKHVTIDRTQADAEATFGQQIRDLKPDIIIDMICFSLESCQQLVEAVQGEVQHFLHCGTIWIHGHTTVKPTTEDQPREPFGNYGKQKSAIEQYLMEMARKHAFPATALHPGHIVGPGHHPLNPAGNKDMRVFETIGRGDELVLPNIGMETLHHVHADDVAQIFMRAIANWHAAVGESFHAVSSAALTFRGFAEAMYRWFGHEPNLSYLGWEEWRQTVSPEHAAATWDHLAHSPNASIEKARRFLDYQPRYTSLQAVFESVQWLIDNGEIQI